MRILVLAATALLATSTTTQGRAEAATRPDSGQQTTSSADVFDKEWALAIYGTGWSGDYGAGGLGARLRFEPLSFLGLEVYAEASIVDWPTSFRHDYPIGFNLYVPIEIADSFRLRVLAGMCTTFSFIEPSRPHAPRADDVMFGLHAGGGAEIALSRLFSLFVDAQWVGYLGHERSLENWTGAVAEELRSTHSLQVNVGLGVHL